MITPIARALVLLFLAATTLHAQEPRLINYKGRVTVNGANFKGTGQFKFAIVDAAGTITRWSNDGTSTAGSEPAAAVTLNITKGAYSVLLGDTTLPNMAAIPAGIAINSDVRLRVWFNDGTNGSQLLMPDKRLAMPHPGQLREDGGTGTDAWHERVAINGTAPAARSSHTAVWTGSEMIVWGGYDGAQYLNDGGRYNPAANSWTGLSTVGAPAARAGHTAVWTGSEMVIWGGTAGYHNYFGDGSRYDPASNSWTAVSGTGAPAARYSHTVVWTGSEMIVWGGTYVPTVSQSQFNDGGRYNPASNSWMAVNLTTAPTKRYNHTAVWTGSEMIVWGGVDESNFNGGGRYNAGADTWTMMTTTGAPAAREAHRAVWTGSEMIVWGGVSWVPDGRGSGSFIPLNDGGRYTPAGNTWAAVATTGAPTARSGGTPVWTGSEMIVWGGYGSSRYHPASNSWTGVSPVAAPAVLGGTAVWTGTEMIVWGGSGDGIVFNDMFIYTPQPGSFLITGAVLSNGTLTLSFPTSAGNFYTLWRSDALADDTWVDTGLPAVVGTGATGNFAVPATTPATRFFRVHADP